MSRVLISGFYGFDNAGDEAVLAAMLQLFRERRPDLAVTVLSASPEATRRLHGCDAVPRMSGRAVMAAIGACDLFVSGGGSLLQDTTSARSALYYLSLIHLASRRRKPVALFCQGIGPLRRPALRRLTRFVLNRASLITVRDEESAQELGRLGVGCLTDWTDRSDANHGDMATGRPGRRGDGATGPAPRPVAPSPRSPRRPGCPCTPSVVVAADPVFALEPAPEFEAERWLPPEPEGGWLGVSVRPWPGIGGLLPGLGAALREVACRTGLTPLLLPLQWDLDQPVCEQLAAHLPGASPLRSPGLDPRGWLALVGRLRGLVAMRLHALIFAGARGTPLAGISYDPKVTALLARLGDRPTACVESFDPAQFTEALVAALADAAGTQRRTEAAAAMAGCARTAAELTLDLI